MRNVRLPDPANKSAAVSGCVAVRMASSRNWASKACMMALARGRAWEKSPTRRNVVVQGSSDALNVDIASNVDGASNADGAGVVDKIIVSP